MGQTKTIRWPLVCIAIVALLLIVPATRSSTWALIRVTTLTLPSRTPQQYQACAKAHPDDYLVQLAYAMNPTDDNEAELDAPGDPALLTALEVRFPNNPSALANGISGTVPEHMLDGRHERKIERGDKSQLRAFPPPASILALLDAQCVAGERIDPGNAYFPAVRMAVLLAQNRDAAAQAELGRAASCTRWSVYSGDVMRGKWRMTELVSGYDPPTRRLIESLHIRYISEEAIRDASRIEAIKAWELDKAGGQDQAIAVRYALMRIGSLGRTTAGPLAESFLCAQMAQISASRLTGPITRPKQAHKVTEEQWRATYYKYLTDHGQASDIPAVGAQFDASEQVHALFESTGTADSIVQRLMVLVGFLILGTMPWNLAMMFIGVEILKWIVSHHPEYWRDKAFTNTKLAGLLTGIVAGSTFATGFISPSTHIGKACIAIGAFAMAATFVGAALGWNRRHIDERLWEWGSAAALLSVATAIALTVVLGWSRLIEDYRFAFVARANKPDPSDIWVGPIFGAMLLLFPLTLYSTRNKPRKTFKYPGLVALPNWIVCGIVLAAAGQIGMAIVNAPTIAGLNAALTAEGPYVARQAHKPWPTAVFDPPSHAWTACK